MRTPLPAIAVLTGAALLLTACSQASSAADGPTSSAAGTEVTKPVTITLESYMPALGTIGQQTIDTLIKNFESANPKVTVKLVADSTATAGVMSAAYQREAATNSLPDVGQVTFDMLRFSASALGAQQLDTRYGADRLSALFGGEYPYATPVTKLGVVDGHTYGVPWTLSTPVLFYNAELLKKAGIATPPETWSAIQADAAKIRTASGAAALANGCVGSGASGSDWCLQAILASDGGAVLKSDGSATTFDDPGNIAALTTMHTLASSGAMVDLTTQQIVQEFASGKVAMVLSTAALQATLLKAAGTSFTVKNTGMPSFSGHEATPTNSGSALEVFAKDPQKQAAAWKLISYLTSPEAETIITSQVGYPPLRPTIAADAKYLKSFATAHPLLAANLAQLERIQPWQSYPGNNFMQIETLITDAATKIAYQGADAASTLKSAQQQAEGLVG